MAWYDYCFWFGLNTETSPSSIFFSDIYTPCEDASFAGHTAFAASSSYPSVCDGPLQHSKRLRFPALLPRNHETLHHYHHSFSVGPEQLSIET